jgi:hydroxyacylglutathione hydrolase
MDFEFQAACGILWRLTATQPDKRRTLPVLLELQRLQVGPWPMNCYLVRCPQTGRLAIVDPGEDAPAILAAVDGAAVCCILLTHAHPDHVGALEAVRQATGAPVGLHPADGVAFGLDGDLPLLDGMEIEVGNGRLVVSHVPGHTPGSVCLRLDGQALVGDAIFPGGPGHTDSPQALAQSLISLGQTVFTWPNATRLYPGHGEHTTVGAERAAFERFVAADHPPELCGDVTWRQD